VGSNPTVPAIFENTNTQEEFVFEVGSVVRLKSGGPKLTISQGSRLGKSTVTWFDAAGQLQTATLDDVLLEQVLTRS